MPAPQDERYEPLPGLLSLPSFLYRKLGPGGRTAVKWYMTDAAPVNIKLEQINRKGHHLPRGSFAVNGRPGSNAVLFKGRIPRKKRLTPGNYRFTVSAATADGRVATPGQLSFTVLRKRHR